MLYSYEYSIFIYLLAGGCGYDTGVNNGAMAWNIAISVTYGNWNIGSAYLEYARCWWRR